MRERVTLRYVPAFVCLAGDCKENCCSGLRVELSEPNHARLVASAAGTRLEERVERLVRLESPATRTARAYAAIDAGGQACPFLDPDWLCAIHRDLGEAALADPCSLFPRVLTEVSGRLELSATLACPEAARLCLTTEGAVDLVPLAPDALAREIVVRRHASADAGGGDPYVELLDDIRQACLEVMRAPGIGVPQRLLLLADLAARVEPFFHAGTTTFALADLRTAIEQVPARAAAIAALWQRTEPSDPLAVRALKDMLIARLPGCDNARFNALVRPLVLRDPAAGKDALVAHFQPGGTPIGIADAALRARLLAAHAQLSAAGVAQLDEYARRYVINSIIKDWYTARPTLASALRRIVIRLALSRFVTLLHPAAAAAAAAEADLATAAVDAFQVIAKNVEHVPSFMDLYERYLGEQHLAGLDGLASLLRV